MIDLLDPDLPDGEAISEAIREALDEYEEQKATFEPDVSDGTADDDIAALLKDIEKLVKGNEVLLKQLLNQVDALTAKYDRASAMAAYYESLGRDSCSKERRPIQVQRPESEEGSPIQKAKPRSKLHGTAVAFLFGPLTYGIVNVLARFFERALWVQSIPNIHLTSALISAFLGISFLYFDIRGSPR